MCGQVRAHGCDADETGKVFRGVRTGRGGCALVTALDPEEPSARRCVVWFGRKAYAFAKPLCGEADAFDIEGRHRWKVHVVEQAVSGLPFRVVGKNPPDDLGSVGARGLKRVNALAAAAAHETKFEISRSSLRSIAAAKSS